MDIAQRKEQFSLAYVHAMAAQAGFNSSRPAVDNDSVDLVLQGRDFTGGIRNPAIDLQLKCTSSPKISGDVLKFSLPIKNYNDLRTPNVLSPRYLFVLLVPDNHSDWIAHHDKHMALHHKCYWTSLRNMPSVDNTTSVTVDVPLQQLLTSDVLHQLLTQASARGSQ
jgi:hypothetical protein